MRVIALLNAALLVIGLSKPAFAQQSDSINVRDPGDRQLIEIMKKRPEARDTYLTISDVRETQTEIKIKDFFSIESEGLGWVRVIHKSPKEGQPHYQLFRFNFKCLKGTLALATGVDYNNDGKIIESHDIPSHQQQDSVAPPDSISANIIAGFCKNLL